MKKLLVPLLLAGSVFMASSAAQTDESETDPGPQPWEICNETSFVMRAAIAIPEDGILTPQGWRRFRPGDCQTITAAQSDQERYIYAESSRAHQGGFREWKGDAEFCADDTDFKADISMSCALQDMGTRPFMPIPDGQVTTRLVEPEDFGTSAQIAGMQRLLMDNGYEISRIDGLSGRRTTRTLDKFLSDNDLPPDLDAEAQIDALEQAALARIGEVGLTLCNSSTAIVWAATGRRHKASWESRGWWEVQPDDCLQIVAESLQERDMHFYAVQQGPGSESDAPGGSDRPLITTAAKPAQFCIAEARFSALGRDLCADKGYQAAGFRVLPNDKDGVTVTLTDADFAAPNPVGLRR